MLCQNYISKQNIKNHSRLSCLKDKKAKSGKKIKGKIKS